MPGIPNAGLTSFRGNVINDINMRTLPLLLSTCFIILSLSAPAHQAFGLESAATSTLDTPWLWPLPPEKPRVQHLKTFITPQDLGVTKGFFAKLWEFIAGEDAVDRILSPHGVAADGNGKVYVADWGAGKIHYFNFEKKKYEQFGKTKSGDLVSPIGVAIDADGLVYITDSVKKRVFVFEGTKNIRIIGDDSLSRPTGITINKKEGMIYVADTLSHRIRVYDLNGVHVRSFGEQGGEDGQFNYPTHLAMNSAGNLYVMDTLNFRVQIFDKNGRFISKFGGNGSAIGDFMKPKGIAVDSEDHIWVSDGLRNSVQVFDREGRLLLIFGKKGIGKGEFDIPAGIHIDAKDRLYVADSYNYRVQMFQYIKQQ